MNSAMKSVCRALRSGKYKQGPNIEMTDGRCCVGGVVIDLYRKKFDIPMSTPSYSIIDDVRVWLDLDEPCMNAFAETTERLNKRCVPFTEIADIIEKVW